MNIKSFVFNPFQENTYVISDESKQCLIIDPGCSNEKESVLLSNYIEKEQLQPVKLLNTHCHLDHILGNQFVFKKFGLTPEVHKLELSILDLGEASSKMWSVPYDPSPTPNHFYDEGDIVKFGNSELKVLFTPGHSPGSICFYSAKEKFMISGDVLFYESIGRTDLPGGNYDTLIQSIKTKLFVLEDDVKIYSGHGLATNIGHEKKNNPFLS